MSSRAVRKLQKLREQELQRAEQQEDNSSDDEPVTQPSKPKLNAFDLLNAGDDEDEDGQDENQEQDDNGVEEPVTQPSEPTPAAKPVESGKKKKNNKKKKKAAAKTTDSEGPEPVKSKNANLDEIDKALKDLAVDNKRPSQGDGATAGDVRDPSFPKTPEELLSIEPRALNAMNEMRKLFGNVVLENFDEPQDAGAGRRRDRNREMVDLGRALTGRYSPASRGQSLAGVTLRRNFLMQGKDEWPRAPSGGLGMELVEKLPTGGATYRILHNTAYQDVQRQFDLCVESMDPQRLIHLLQYNPYHISTLLQVSEIAKHQSDHAVSADLLERALFNIGRSAHSSFSNRLKEGQSKLDFVHFENRELWLVGWRYIANLGMKGTWRTAYEWAKLLLSLNADDPYCIRLVIDHLALRGREYSHFVELCTQTRLSKEWAQFPNIQCSLALAYLRLNKPKECREKLGIAMSRYPWVFCKLAQELDIQPMPKRIWGKMPPTGSHELLTELYVARAKDLWNTPEAISLIMEVSDTLPEEEEPIEPPEITLDIARHVVISDIPRVTTHLPNRFVSGRISASDPLPPYESEAFRQQSDPTPSYLSQVPEGGRPQWLRDLLDQLHNGALPFPRFQQGGNEEVREDDVPSDIEVDRERPTENAVPSAEQQALLEQWLLGQGMQSLEDFLRQYGVDRGNWGDVTDYTPLSDYLDALDNVHPESARQRLLDGPIREAMGDIVVDMLEDELQMPVDDDGF
ncbi:hypothetical protein ASPWEDRAFT_38308 [Aspergillus wentii DTO 134E9]|uniref:Nulp1-pending protein n=1 Tax=Aspergillus wentii DTO 134E9 TaxID=1073089 RepID=A0A1L9RP45_ASPWE|nr:uncharacterized protein ASPWEDRAFT_38308 [Aspergillus wentii DTO 134E9]KAI9934160.1 hypothetical protein MW887_005233 [Aspergillus wentii]OJJ36701.1 hypothetical protein ASPWEDRAFT_38308 [Aspergillus wentii DTO 134E9]